MVDGIWGKMTFLIPAPIYHLLSTIYEHLPYAASNASAFLRASAAESASPAASSASA